MGVTCEMFMAFFGGAAGIFPSTNQMKKNGSRKKWSEIFM